MNRVRVSEDARDEKWVTFTRRRHGVVMLFPGQQLESIPFAFCFPRPTHLRVNDIERLRLMTTFLNREEYKEWTPSEGGGLDKVAIRHRLVRSVPNSMIKGNLGEISENKSFAMLAILSLVYGGIYTTSWNSHFPTDREQKMWHICYCIASAGGFVIWLTSYSWIRMPLGIQGVDGPGTAFKYFASTLVVFQVMAFGVPRIFLVVESFIGVRSLPMGAYSTMRNSTGDRR